MPGLRPLVRARGPREGVLELAPGRAAHIAPKRASTAFGSLIQRVRTSRAIGSGAMYSSPDASASSTAFATSAGAAFGIAVKSRAMSVSTGPGRTSWTEIRFPARSGRIARVREYAAAFDAE